MLDTSTDQIRIVAALHPLKFERSDIVVSPGNTIAEIFDIVQPDPMLRRAAHVYIGDHYVPRENWARVRPKAGSLISIRAFIPPQGGSGDAGGAGGKDILRTVLLIAVAAAALFVPGALGLTGILAFGAQAAIGLGGMLLVNALIPPRSNNLGATDRISNLNDSPTKFIESARNRANPFGPVPVIFGRHKVVPLLGANWTTEIVGDDQYLRGLLVWGVGPLDLSTFKIGETLLTDFSDYQIEHRYGYLTDTDLTLYTETVDQQSFQITLLAVDGYTVRTTSADADEISVDLILPEGCLTLADDGTRSNRSVAIQLEYSVAGAGVWNEIPVANGTTTFPIGWTDSNGTQFNTITFTHKRTNAIRHGLSWKVPTRGQYDVRIKRLTADSVSDTIRDTIVWATLRRITNENPINSPVPVAMTAIRIKATDQLSNVIDEFNGIATMVALDWNGATWVEQATQNPASAYRHALQGKALQVPYADADIDLTMLQYWHEFCTAKGFKFNQVRDFYSSLDDLLADIAASGRASPTTIDGKRSVIIDEPKTAVSHVTPRNSAGFKATKTFVDKPHGFRVQFNNELEDFRNDEVRVYIDGYTAATATKFEHMEHPGVTDPDLITRHTRFNAAVAVHRPEQWMFTQDMERFVYKRGDMILVTHDVLLVGLAYGRIKSVQLSGGDCIGVTVDENLPMEEFKFYGMSIRTVANVALTTQVVTVPGNNTAITFVTPIPAADIPSVGDLFGFGLLSSETDTALVLSIDPNSDYHAEITCSPYREIVYTIDAEPIPAFETNLTPIALMPSVTVEYVRSDETVLTVGAGDSLSVHVNVKIRPVTDMDVRLETQIRPSTTEEPFAAAQVDSYIGNEVSIGDVRTGEYVDLRFRWTATGRTPGDWTYIYNHLVVGKSTDPDPLLNMTISTFGGQAFIRWDKPTELDVIFGGEVRFRHSTDAIPTWGNSTSIGNVAQARSLLATLPLKPGTYLARVFDQAGNYSTVEMINTTQASVLTFANVNSLDEAPGFDGTRTNVAVDAGALKLASVGQWDDIPNFDTEENIDAYGGTITTTAGEYLFLYGFDFTIVKNVRLTVRLNVFISAVFDLIDSWIGNIDDRANFDGNDTADCDCIVYVSTTLDDPGGVSPTWTLYERLDSMEVRARGCRFKALLTSANSDFNIFVTELGVDAEEIV